jgi:hypothetical protein
MPSFLKERSKELSEKYEKRGCVSILFRFPKFPKVLVEFFEQNFSCTPRSCITYCEQARTEKERGCVRILLRLCQTPQSPCRIFLSRILLIVARSCITYCERRRSKKERGCRASSFAYAKKIHKGKINRFRICTLHPTPS